MEINSISRTLDKNTSTTKNRKISKLRKDASQFYAATATNIVKLAVGSFIGFTTVLVAELYKEDAEIDMSVSELTWFSSHCFMVPVGALVTGSLAQRIGSRTTMLIASVFYVMSCLLFHFATNSSMLLGAQAIVGLFGMVSVGPGVTYIVEVTQPHLRSALTASTTLSTMSSAFLIVLLSNFLHWRVIALVMLGFPIVGFVAVCTIPESPHWLASKGKLDKAEAALSWLRGWSTPQNVVSEFNTLKETYPSSGDSKDSSSENNTPNPKSVCYLKHIVRTYLHRSFYIPLSMICLMFTLHCMTGYGPLITYCIVIFSQINAPIDPHVAASIFDAMRILGAIVCVLSVHYTGKKKLMNVSLIGAGIAHFTVSTALLLKNQQIYPDTCQWVAAIAMIITTFLSSAGIDKIVYMLNAELFPTKYRNVGVGIGLFTSSISGAIFNKTFLLLLDLLTLPGIFITFGITCIISCTLFHFMFPETEGKTLQEIEGHYDGTKRLGKEGKIQKMSTEVSCA